METTTKTQPSSPSSSLPCAACRLLRRRCTKECILAPHFPSSHPHKFAIVHKLFGASNISKHLREVRGDQRADAVSSLVYEASAREKDPIYGCVATISYLHNQVCLLQAQLADAQAEILCAHLQLQQSSTLEEEEEDPCYSSSPFLSSSSSPSPYLALLHDPLPLHADFLWRTPPPPVIDN